ncbi:MAG: ABC transporter permease, partial [Myxococcales bacterium]|nr:ABC transporter permease [Myxococcales bacterium]
MGGVNLATLAWRNLWRNRRRTIITLSGYAFGVMLAVIFIGLGDDSYGKMIDMAARNGAGHVTIQHAEYLDTPSLKKTVDDVTRLRARAQEAEEVVTVTTRITGPAMLATARKSYGAFFVALDPAQETPETFGLLSSLREGALFTGADDEGVILGATLAENLHAGLGRKVVYTMTDKSGEMTSGMARVSGIIETGDDGLDAAFFMLPLGRARAQLGYGADEAGQIAVFVGEQRGSEAIAA